MHHDDIGLASSSGEGKSSPTGLLTVSKLPTMPMWDPSEIVAEALKYHSLLGDVQTSVSVLVVLGEQRKCLKQLELTTQEQWTFGKAVRQPFNSCDQYW